MLILIFQGQGFCWKHNQLPGMTGDLDRHGPTHLWPFFSSVVYTIKTWSWCRFYLTSGQCFRFNHNWSPDLDVWPWKPMTSRLVWPSSSLVVCPIQTRPTCRFSSLRCQRTYSYYNFLFDFPEMREFHTQMCSIFIFSVNHQGHVNDSGLLEILDIGNVRIDTLDQVYMSTAGAK